MTTTKQPIWKELFKSDDNAVYWDTTGVYPPEMEVAQGCDDDDDDSAVFQVFRFSLEQLVQRDVDGVMVLVSQHIDACDRRNDLPYPLKDYDEWFVKDLGGVARCIGATAGDLTDWLCGENIGERAQAYYAIGSYHGFMNLDSYPLEMTVAEWNKR